MSTCGNCRPQQPDRLDANTDESHTDEEECEEVEPQYQRTSCAPDDSLYPMDGEKAGKVLIFSWHLADTDKDIERLSKVLRRVGITKDDITEHRFMNSNDISRTMENLKDDVHLENCNCLIVVIIAHALKDDRWMAQGSEYDFLDKLTPRVLKSLTGKPKLCMIQTCVDEEQQAIGSPNENIDSHVQEFSLPEFADFLMIRSSHRGHRTGQGIIQELCKVLKNCNLKESSICDILTETIGAMAERGQGHVPSFYSTLTKGLYFKEV